MAYSGSYASPRVELGEAFKEYMFNTDDFIGTRVLSLLPSSRKKGSFSSLKREKLLQVVSENKLKRGPKSAYARAGWEGADKEFDCKEYGIEVPSDHVEEAFYANDFDAALAASEIAWSILMLGHEQRVRDLVFNTTTFTTVNGLRTDVSAAWSAAATDIIADIQDAKEVVRQRTGMNPNALVVGAGVVPYFLKNAGIKSAMPDTQEKNVEAIKRALAAIFGLEHILVGGTVKNTAKEGQAASITDVWDTAFASVATIAPSGGSVITPCLGRTVLWTEDSPDAVMTEEYEEPQTRSTIYRTRHHTDELLLDASFAQLLDIAA